MSETIQEINKTDSIFDSDKLHSELRILDCRAPDFGEEGRAGVAARVAAEGVSDLAQDDRADLAERQVRADRLSEHQLLRGAEAEETAEQHG